MLGMGPFGDVVILIGGGVTGVVVIAVWFDKYVNNHFKDFK